MTFSGYLRKFLGLPPKLQESIDKLYNAEQ